MIIQTFGYNCQQWLSPTQSGLPGTAAGYLLFKLKQNACHTWVSNTSSLHNAVMVQHNVSSLYLQISSSGWLDPGLCLLQALLHIHRGIQEQLFQTPLPSHVKKCTVCLSGLKATSSLWLEVSRVLPQGVSATSETGKKSVARGFPLWLMTMGRPHGIPGCFFFLFKRGFYFGEL